ncbi:DUF4240 domain-containing protein [Microbacterium tumbae]
MIAEIWTSRVLFRSGQEFDDLVLYGRSEDDDFGYYNTTGEAVVLAKSQVPVEADTGPVVVIDRILPTRFDDPLGWVDTVTSDVILEVPAEDPSPRTLMSDTEFWGLIDLLGGLIDYEGIMRLADGMAELSYREILSFRDTLWARLHELDQPGNTVERGGVVSADASLYYRCEIIAAGRETFLDLVRDARQGIGDAGADGEPLLYVAEDVSERDLPPAEVEIETGHNRQYWPDAPGPVAPEWEVWPSPGPFSEVVRETTSLRGVRLRRNLTSFLAYTTKPDGTVRELMGCLMAGSLRAAREEVLDFLSWRVPKDEALHPSLPVYQLGVASPTKGRPLAGIFRRNSLSMDEYIQTYYLGERPAPKPPAAR